MGAASQLFPRPYRQGNTDKAETGMSFKLVHNQIVSAALFLIVSAERFVHQERILMLSIRINSPCSDLPC